MRLPDFLIIGAAKSGTTTLYEYLCQHPQIYMSTPKEPDFFAVDEVYAKGMDWYSELFQEATSNQICGEASTTYSRLQKHPQAAERIAQALPKVKLIYILRQPIDRAYSFYVFRLKTARYAKQFAVPKTFEETIGKHNEFLDSSDYMYQIEKYLQLFPRESILLLLMEDLIKKPEETINKVLHFLEVDANVNLIENGVIVANKVTDHPEWFVKKQLTGSIKSVPGVAQLSKLFPKSVRNLAYQGIKRLKYKDWAEQQYLPPPMLPETRQMLIQRFREPNQKLAEFLHRDLSHWNE